MSKYTVTELWSRFFGTKQEVYDYAVIRAIPVTPRSITSVRCPGAGATPPAT